MLTLWIGIDVAKLVLQICVLFPSGERLDSSFPNTPAGRKELLAWLKGLGENCELKVCLESTGCYHNAIASELCEEGIWVAVLNPRSVKHFGISLGARNKNDAVDARLIARFGKERDPKRWALADPDRREICQLLAHLDRIHKTLRIHANSLEDESLSKTVLRSIQRLLKSFQEELQKISQRIDELLKANGKLWAIVEAISKVKGVGRMTAIQFAARLDVDAFDSAEQAAAFAGLNPCQRQSGKNQGRTVLSKQGDAALRKAFYFPAITAARYHPKIRDFKERLKAKNKRPSAIRAACMRKLLMICFGVAKRTLNGAQPFYAA